MLFKTRQRNRTKCYQMMFFSSISLASDQLSNRRLKFATTLSQKISPTTLESSKSVLVEF